MLPILIPKYCVFEPELREKGIKTEILQYAFQKKEYENYGGAIFYDINELFRLNNFSYDVGFDLQKSYLTNQFTDFSDCSVANYLENNFNFDIDYCIKQGYGEIVNHYQVDFFKFSHPYAKALFDTIGFNLERLDEVDCSYLKVSENDIMYYY